MVGQILSLRQSGLRSSEVARFYVGSPVDLKQSENVAVERHAIATEHYSLFDMSIRLGGLCIVAMEVDIYMYRRYGSPTRSLDHNMNLNANPRSSLVTI
jgi:hypothetical protein